MLRYSVFVYIRTGGNIVLVICLVETKAIDIPTQSFLTASHLYPSQQPCVFSGVLGTESKLIIT